VRDRAKRIDPMARAGSIVGAMKSGPIDAPSPALNAGAPISSKFGGRSIVR